MKFSFKYCVLAAILWLTASGLFAANNGTVTDDLRLWYRQPAKDWRESLFIGNGRLGGAVWGGVQQERIGLN